MRVLSTRIPRASMKSPPKRTNTSVPAPVKKVNTRSRLDMKFLKDVFSAKVLLPPCLGPPTNHPKKTPMKTNDITANKAWVPPIWPMS